MKRRKERRPIIRNKKLRGEWAEMCFMVRATEHGLPVCKPWGESRSFDFVVGWPGHFVAVQVKSTICELGAGYACTLRGSQNRGYARGSFDFLAAYVIFEDCWYIVPEAVIEGMERISLASDSERAQYEKYREAWHLLQRANGSSKIDDLKACAEEYVSRMVEPVSAVPRFAMMLGQLLCRQSASLLRGA
jgi:hypothetical protein